MSVPDQDAPLETVWRGRFIEARRRGRWEFVARVGGIHAAVILAIDADDHVLLISQYRVPLDRECVELPAGLVGDESAGEAIEVAAARELEEETGYRPERIEVLGEFFSSPGMNAESFTLVRAHGLTRVDDGGGVEGEGITVHRVPRSDISSFIAARRAEGMAIDVKLLVLLNQLASA